MGFFMDKAVKLLAQATGQNTGSTGFDLNQYNASQAWDISKIMNFGYAGYKTFLIIFTLLGIFGIAGLVITLATSGENSGRQRFAVGGLLVIVLSVGLAYLAPWLMSVVSSAAANASR